MCVCVCVCVCVCTYSFCHFIQTGCVCYSPRSTPRSHTLPSPPFPHPPPQAGALQEATALLQTQMGRAGVAPSGITVCALLNAYFGAGKADEALALFESLPDRGLPRDGRVRDEGGGVSVCVCRWVCVSVCV